MRYILASIFAAFMLLAPIPAMTQTAPLPEAQIQADMGTFIGLYGGGEVVEITDPAAVKRFMDVVNEVPPVTPHNPGDKVLALYLPMPNVGLFAIVNKDGVSYEEGRFTVNGDLMQRALIASKGPVEGEEKL